jgi:hypothetical protein
LIGATPGNRLTLTGFETGIRFANHKDLAATTDDLAVTMAGLGRLERIKDFHGYIFLNNENGEPVLYRQNPVKAITC